MLMMIIDCDNPLHHVCLFGFFYKRYPQIFVAALELGATGLELFFFIKDYHNYCNYYNMTQQHKQVFAMSKLGLQQDSEPTTQTDQKNLYCQG